MMEAGCPWPVWDARATLHCPPISGNRSIFILFTLPALAAHFRMAADMSVIACLIAAVFVVVTGGARILPQWRSSAARRDSGAACRSASPVLFMLAVRAYLDALSGCSRMAQSFGSRTQTHVALSGTLVVSVASSSAGHGGIAAVSARARAGCSLPQFQPSSAT